MKRSFLITAISFLLLFTLLLPSCNKKEGELSNMITEKYFDTTSDGKKVTSYRITNNKGEYVEILDFGATINKICVLDGDGKLKDVALGFDSLDGYMTTGMYAGATVGRVANRISNAKFTLNDVTYNLAANDNTNSIHGGNVGFDKKIFTKTSSTENSITFELFSPDGDENYPGNLTLKVTFTFDDNASLSISYEAVSDKDTIFSPTNHSYFNLDGQDSNKNIYDTYLMLNSDITTHLGEDFTPTGELVPTNGGNFDFTTFKKIGKDIDNDDAQLKLATGYDINYVITKNAVPKEAGNLTLVEGLPSIAFAYSDTSKIIMAVQSDRPGVQLYTGNFITDGTVGKSGATYNFRYGFCLETQGYPDSINKNFPSDVLKAGEVFKSKTVYTFGVVNN